MVDRGLEVAGEEIKFAPKHRRNRARPVAHHLPSATVFECMHTHACVCALRPIKPGGVTR